MGVWAGLDWSNSTSCRYLGTHAFEGSLVRLGNWMEKLQKEMGGQKTACTIGASYGRLHRALGSHERLLLRVAIHWAHHNRGLSKGAMGAEYTVERISSENLQILTHCFEEKSQRGRRHGYGYGMHNERIMDPSTSAVSIDQHEIMTMPKPKLPMVCFLGVLADSYPPQSRRMLILG